MSALAWGPRETEPALSVARASNSRLKKVLAPVVHLVAWNSLSKKLLDWNGTGGHQVEAEKAGFFHFGRIDGHGEAYGIEEDSDPGDAGGWTLALVLSCV